MHTDPRFYQIAALITLIGLGVVVFDFSINVYVAITIVLAALVTQFVIRAGQFDPYSALISSLSLCLLLRTNSLAVAALAACIAIGSKKLFRIDGKHFFNPTAFALVIVTAVFESAWISPGQWGHMVYLLVFVAGIGSLVSSCAARLDISLSFLASFALIAFARAYYLDDPVAIALHQLNNSALLVFAFFMISDPRTTPQHRVARIIFAGLVATVGAVIEFVFFRANGAIHALVLCAPLVPLFDRLTRYRPTHRPASQSPSSNQLLGVNHG